MIIPDQFVLLLALSSIGFIPLWKEDLSLAGRSQLPTSGYLVGTGIAWPEGFWQPFIGMVIGGGFMLLCAIAGKLIFKQDAFGFGFHAILSSCNRFDEQKSL